MASEISMEVRDLCVRLCKLVRAKQSKAPPTHSVPSMSVVVNEPDKKIWIRAQNFPQLRQYGEVVARTLHQESWHGRYGRDPLYARCVEVAKVEANPTAAEWDATILELMRRGYEVLPASKFGLPPRRPVSGPSQITSAPKVDQKAPAASPKISVPATPSRQDILLGVVASDLQSLEAEAGSEPLFEGGRKQRLVNTYERNPALRAQAILIHGTACKVCGFEFSVFYGRRGVDYIEVHHTKPVSTLKTAAKVDPNSDMTVLCSNCHRMVHRSKDDVLPVEDLMSLIKTTIQLPRQTMPAL